MHPLDPDAKIAKMKDGRTHLAHKAAHAIDLETGAIVGGHNRGLIKTPNGVQCTRTAGVFEAAVANGSCADAEKC